MAGPRSICAVTQRIEGTKFGVRRCTCPLAHHVDAVDRIDFVTVRMLCVGQNRMVGSRSGDGNRDGGLREQVDDRPAARYKVADR